MITPDPKAVREIARTAVGYLPQDHVRGRLVQCAIAEHGIDEHDLATWSAYFDAVLAAVKSATATASWPDEQPQDDVAPYRPLPYDDEFIDILQGGSFYAEVTAFRRLAATIGVEQTYRKWTMLQRRARTDAGRPLSEQPQDERDGDVRAVAELLRTLRYDLMVAQTGLDEPTAVAVVALETRFSDRIAALEARDAKGGE